MNAAELAGLDPPVVVEPAEPAAAAVVWLHGLGADGHDFEPVAAELGKGGLDDVRYVFPHAPVRPVTVNGGMAMRAWYDIAGPELDRRADMEGVRASAGIAHALIDDQIAYGIPPGTHRPRRILPRRRHRPLRRASPPVPYRGHPCALDVPAGYEVARARSA